jgi:hypothetical protein
MLSGCGIPSLTVLRELARWNPLGRGQGVIYLLRLNLFFSYLSTYFLLIFIVSYLFLLHPLSYVLLKLLLYLHCYLEIRPPIVYILIFFLFLFSFCISFCVMCNKVLLLLFIFERGGCCAVFKLDKFMTRFNVLLIVRFKVIHA